METRGSFPGVKRPGREADHSLPSSAEVKERVELYRHSPNKPSWRGAQLKHRNNFTLAFTFAFNFTLRVSMAARLRADIVLDNSNSGSQVKISFNRRFFLYSISLF
jgi:hypothetical protein